MIVEFVLAAELELDDAISYLENQRAGLGVELARDGAATIQSIIEYPSVWQRLPGGVLRCQLKQFEYGLVYKVGGDVATIYAVMHLQRKPGYWRKRLRPPPAL
jgi:toxin ParE1/3/4